jgi:hypothetical protein
MFTQPNVMSRKIPRSTKSGDDEHIDAIMKQMCKSGGNKGGRRASRAKSQQLKQRYAWNARWRVHQ